MIPSPHQRCRPNMPSCVRARTAAHIAARCPLHRPPEAVWAVLMDFSKYPEWNPFILSIEGPAEVGAKLNVRHLQSTYQAASQDAVVSCEPRHALRSSILCTRRHGSGGCHYSHKSCAVHAQCVSWSKLGEGYKFEPTVEVCKRPREFLWKATSLQARGAGMCMHVSCCLACA